MIRHWIFECLSLLSLVYRTHQIHEQITAEEIHKVFRIGPNPVPENQVVPVLKINDDTKNVELHPNFFGSNVNLYLNPTEGQFLGKRTPIYTVKSNTSNPDKLEYELISGVESIPQLKEYNEESSKENSDDIPFLSPNAAPEVVYPEILVLIDYESYKSHGSDINKTIVYYAAFFNAVDLKYRSLNEPKVRLHIAGIIVALDKEATPYLNKQRINDDLLNSNALEDLCLYLFEEKRFPRNSYDVAIAITKSKLCQYQNDSKQSSDCYDLRGISKYGSACDWDPSTKRVESAALVHDAGFDGIATAAHELAHVFGVPHDGSSSLAYIGGPGAKSCKWDDGYLMSSLRYNKNALIWSNCSQDCFKYFFSKPKASCLYNKPTNGIALPRLLPGKLLSVDEQCLKATGGKSCWQDERVCILLWCRAPKGNADCLASAPAAEGSSCADGKICIQGNCVKE